MKRFLAALALALFLPACATLSKIESVQISPTQIVVIDSTFGAVEATATNYLTLQHCLAGQTFLKNQCSSKAAVPQIVSAIHAGRVARDNLKTFALAHPGNLGASGLYDAFSTAIATLRGILLQYGVTA